MELRQIQFFLQLYKDRNMTIASKNQYISQQGFSKSISALETELGFPLFYRSYSGITPTEAATELYLYFDSVMNAYNTLNIKINSIKNSNSGMLHIVWPEAFPLSCNKESYMSFSAMNPDMAVLTTEEHESSILHMLREHIADIGFFYEPIPNDFVSHTKIFEEPLYALLDSGHPLAEEKELTIPMLKDYYFFFPQKYNITKKLFLKKAKEEYPSINLQIAPLPLTQILHAVFGTKHIGITPKIVYQYFNFPDIKFIPIVDEDKKIFYTMSLHLIGLKEHPLKKETQIYIEHTCKIYKS